VLLRDIDNIRLEIYLPHIPARQEGDNRVTRIVDDILVILSCLDENLKLDCLPKYVSDNPDTMPSVPLYEGDLEVLIKAIEKIKSRMDEFRSQLTAIASEVQVLSTLKRPEASSDVRANKDVGILIPTDVMAGSSSWSDTAGHSYADEFPTFPNDVETESVPDPQGWKLVTRHRPSSPKTSAVA